MIKKLHTALSFLALSTLASQSLANTISAQALDTVKNNSALFNQLCSSNVVHCTPHLQIWQAKNNRNVFYTSAPSVCIDRSYPNDCDKTLTLNRIIRNKNSFDFDSRWLLPIRDPHDRPENIDTDAHKVYIHPVLYPVNHQEWAIAVVSAWDPNTPHTIETANFFQLNSRGTSSLAFKNILFSRHGDTIQFTSSNSSTGCTGRQVTQPGTNCYDKKWQTLTVSIQDTGADYYQWQFTQQANHWPAYAPKSATISEVIDRFDAYPLQAGTPRESTSIQKW